MTLTIVQLPVPYLATYFHHPHARRREVQDTFIALIGIGLALFTVEIAGVYYTGASVNPARSLWPCVAGASF
jgi:glycerol uptake facilitator-like aquaporin